MRRRMKVLLVGFSMAVVVGPAFASDRLEKGAPVVTGNPGDFLLLDAQCGVSHAYFWDALINLGVPYVRVTLEQDLYAGLIGGTDWGAAIIDNYGQDLSANTNAAIRDYIAAGGLIHANSYNWEEATAAAFEATLGSTYDTPQEIYRWDTAHDLFTNPNDVPDLMADFDTCATEGYLLSTAGAGRAIAGYFGGEAAIIVGNQGRTVLFGGTLGMFGGDWDNVPNPIGDGKIDGLEYAENAVDYLQNHIFGDGFESGGIIGWSFSMP